MRVVESHRIDEQEQTDQVLCLSPGSYIVDTNPGYMHSTKIGIAIRDETEDSAGLSERALLALLTDHLQLLQQGPLRCPENDLALTHLFAVMTALKLRDQHRREIRNRQGDRP